MTDRGQDGGDADDADHSFWCRFTSLWIFAVSHDHFPDQRFAEQNDETANGDAEEGETCDAERPAANICENDWVGHETKVEDAVDDANVHIPKQTAKVIHQHLTLTFE